MFNHFKKTTTDFALLTLTLIPTIGRFAVRVGLTAIVLGLVAVPQVAVAQRILLFENFERDTPDTLPASADTFNRSVVIEDDPADAFVTGGAIADPFDPGNNQSLVLFNPNNAAQMGINWFSIFPDDSEDPNYYLRNGVIEFDVFIDTLQSDGWFGFLAIRFGWEENPEERNQVSTDGDQAIWNSFRLQEGGASGAGNTFFDQTNAELYSNDNLLDFERPMRVRYEIDGNTTSYTVSIDNLEDTDDPIEVIWPGSGIAAAPWEEVFNFITFQFEPAPGINEITFMTDASARGAGSLSSPNVYIDNLRIIDNDQEPDGLAANFDNDGDVDGNDFLEWQRGDSPKPLSSSDLTLWEDQYGTTSSIAATASIPEPSTLLLSALAAVGLLMRRW